jgi:hypothetical protein
MYDTAPLYRDGYDPQTGAYAAPLDGTAADRTFAGDYAGGTYDECRTTAGRTALASDPMRNV